MPETSGPILVTGGDRGIGRATSVALARSGHDLILHFHRDRAAAEETAEVCQGLGVRVDAVSADLRRPEDILRLSGHIRGLVPALSGLVNNAGVYEGSDLGGTTLDEWERVMAINLRAPFFLIRHLAPLIQAGHGSVVNVSSILGVTASPGSYPYQASKAALVHLTQSLALELAPAVRVNAVVPGFIRTDMNRDGWQDPAFHQEVVQDTPLGRWGEVDDVAPAILFLLSDAARFITGQALSVDGGKSLH
jgi:NAD(P)-dependent dehydrogenase (short-subunit alcohol dehydrogenase family)